MNRILKNTVKFAAGTCIALGSVAVAASVVGGSSAAKVVSAGVKAAKDAMKEEIGTLKAETSSIAAAKTSPPVTEEAAMFADLEETAQENSEN